VLLEDFGRELTTEAKDVVVRLSRAARRLESLTRDLLAFSRVSVEKVALTPVQVGPILEDIFAMRAPEVREAATVKEPLHPVRAHAALLQQAIANLVDNAVKFVAPGQKPRITIWTQKVGEISPNTRMRALSFSSIESIKTGDAPAPDTADRVRIWVADQGIGIPREVHPKIFGIFERAVTIEQYEGTGIGLAIVARALQRMEGTCGVESEPGQGSRFWLELPAA
jgi:signal transduction histidine kinase